VVRVGDLHIGVRSSTLGVRDAFEQALSEHLVDDPEAQPSYAIYQTEVTLRGARPRYRVYHNCDHIFTASSLDRAVAVVIANLEHHLPRGMIPRSVLELDVAAVVSPSAAVLLPWPVPYRVPDMELRLKRSGLRQLEGASVFVDVASAEVLVPRRRLTDRRWQHPSDGRGAATTPLAASGRLRIASWGLLRSVGDSMPQTRARAVWHGMSIVFGHHPQADNLRGLAELVGQIDIDAIDSYEEAVPFSMRWLAT